MSLNSPYMQLPAPILSQASLRGNEYAWPIDTIPFVIAAAREASLVSVGGQLQFRLTDGGTCECYWIEVDTYKTVPERLPWEDRVHRTADAALTDFERLRSKVNFLDEGRRSFSAHFNALEERGGDPAEAMCFVWYLLDRASKTPPE